MFVVEYIMLNGTIMSPFVCIHGRLCVCVFEIFFLCVCLLSMCLVKTV